MPVQESTVLGDSAVARSAVEFAGRVVASRDLESGLERKLDAAGVPLRPAEWLLIHVGIAIGVTILVYALTGASVVPAVIALILGFVGPFLYLVIKESRRLGAFLAQLPDTLQLIAGSLSAGYSLPQAVDAVVREGTNPIAGEFNRALVESRLGVPIEDALDGIAGRMKSEDFGWVVMAIRIQREVGGNLAEVLQTVSHTLRERERLRRQVQVLSAEGRLLVAVDLQELLTNQGLPRQTAERLAVDLGNNPGRLRALRAKLSAKLPTCALFDAAAYTRNLEAAFVAMHARRRAGLPPIRIDV